MIVVSVAALYLIACGLLYAFQRTVLYHPSRRAAEADERSIFIESGGEKIRVIVARSSTSNGSAIIYFGGNGESVADTSVSLAREFSDRDIYCMDYRGFGGSSGKPTEAGIFEDALAIYDLVQRGHSEVAVIGRSLGSGVGVYVASQRPVAKLVLITPYDSIENIAAERFPIFPVRQMLEDKYDSASRAIDVHAKVLVFLAEDDRVIPLANSQNLIHYLLDRIVKTEIPPGTDHNSIITNEKMFASIREFLGPKLGA